MFSMKMTVCILSLDKAFKSPCLVRLSFTKSASVYLFEPRRHAPATGLHDAVVAAHVLAHLPVLLPPLLSAGQQRRVTEERRNTVTRQSGSTGGGKRERKAKR